jgi:uncharacterized protein (UPF0332 family)
MAKAVDRTKRLIRVTMAKKIQLLDWAEGASLVADFGVSIKDLQRKAVRERWNLALEHRKEGRRLLAIAIPPYRAAVSRFYYVMYHSMRAVCYMHHCGDDYEEHSTLPKHLPPNFPNASIWSNTLKRARLDRNSADYDPYPKSTSIWRARATSISSDADILIREVRTYLRSKGFTDV